MNREEILYTALLQTLADWDMCEYSSLRGEGALDLLKEKAEARIKRAEKAINQELCPECHHYGGHTEYYDCEGIEDDY